MVRIKKGVKGETCPVCFKNDIEINKDGWYCPHCKSAISFIDIKHSKRTMRTRTKRGMK